MRAGPLSILLVALLMACGGPPEQRHVSGSRYGGVFNINETEALRSIFPLTLTQASSFHILSQVYQGLVTFDPKDLRIAPCLAETWEVDATATSYTFHLRKGVRFHDDPAFPEGQGREVTADDVVRCFNIICTHGPGDGVFWLFQDRVVGANEHYAATGIGQVPQEGVTGIQRVDENTVRIILSHPSPNFLQIIAHQGCWIWPEELTAAYGMDPHTKAIGTGPFRLNEFDPAQVMVLDRNPDYWGHDATGGALPYLDAVRVTFTEDKNTEFDAFLHGRLTALLELPVDRLTDLGDSTDQVTRKRRFFMLSRPSLTSQFYGFDAFHAPFNDPRVRQAVSLAIDRRFLVDSILGGMATPAAHGLVAPGLAGYPYDSVPGVPFDPDRARALLAEAGYPEGKGFPPLQLQVNADGFGYVRVAEAVQAMIERELHLPISVSVMPADRHYDRVDRGQVRLWREGWTADHPDPENFLALLYGKNAVQDSTLPASINKSRFNDPDFNAHFANASMASDETVRMRELALAEHVALNRMPIAPLYHEQAVYLLQPFVRDLYLNAIEYLDLTAVWFDRDGNAAVHP